MGGFFSLRVQSVRIVDTNKNYMQVLTALFILDSMVSDAAADMKITPEIIKMITEFTSLNQASSTFDRYIVSMVKSYIRRKKQIVINLDELSKQEEKLYSLIIEDGFRKEQTENCDVTNIESKTNLISSDIFIIFPNVRHIMIETTTIDDIDGEDSYPFNLTYLLSIISSSSTWATITVKQMRLDEAIQQKKDMEDTSWIFKLWSSSSNRLMQEFEKNKLKITFGSETTHFESKGSMLYSWLTIERLNS